MRTIALAPIALLVCKRASGSGGCNRFTGGYELDGERLSFGRMAATMMACADAMDTEKAFLSAFQQPVRRGGASKVKTRWPLIRGI